VNYIYVAVHPRVND